MIGEEKMVMCSVERVCVLLVLGTALALAGDVCNEKLTCGDCISAPMDCAWCKDPSFTNGSRARCALRSVMLSMCQLNFIEDPRSQLFTQNTTTNQSSPLIVPQVINASLRPGEVVSFDFLVNTPSDNPLDIYFLMDISASLSDDIAFLRQLSSNLTDVLEGLTTSLHLGIGTFVDKPILPYTPIVDFRNVFGYCITFTLECVPAYSYRHLLPLTPNTTLFQKTLDTYLNISLGVDNPEGGFDALLQAAVCTEVIGWRSKAQRLVVLMTDAPPHIAGDGRVAGILTPNDGKCHMSVPNGGQFPEYSYWNELDYPSVYQLQEILSQRQITPIFVTVEDIKPAYLMIQKQLEQSLVGTFDSTNLNFISLIEAEVKNAIVRQVVLVENEGITGYQFNLTVVDGCDSKTSEGYCEVQPGQVVTYRFSIKAEQCHSKREDFRINVFGLGSIQVSIETICRCQCEDTPVLNYTGCSNGRGNLVCGDCSCNNLTVEYQCLMSESGICSGHGQCSGCGECMCDSLPDGRKYNGEACQFDNTCIRDQNGALCGGRGNCSNGRCDCVTSSLTGLPFTGDLCDCSPDNNSCINPDSPQHGLCSRHGQCSCNKCQCDLDFGGMYCELCLSSSCLSCEASRPCVLCAKGLVPNPCDNCSSTLLLQTFTGSTQDDVNRTYAGQELMECVPIVDEDECLHEYFTAEHPVTGVVTIIANSGRLCFVNPVPWIIVGVLFIVVFSAGVIVLVIIKLILMYLDYKEVKRLDEETKHSRWSQQINPLYVSPTIEYTNIAYQIKQRQKKRDEEIRRVSDIITSLDNLDILFPELPPPQPHPSDSKSMTTSFSMPTLQVHSNVPSMRTRPTSAMLYKSTKSSKPVGFTFSDLETVVELETLANELEAENKHNKVEKEKERCKQESDSEKEDSDEISDENDDEDHNSVDGSICWQYPTSTLPSNGNNDIEVAADQVQPETITKRETESQKVFQENNYTEKQTNYLHQNSKIHTHDFYETTI